MDDSNYESQAAIENQRDTRTIFSYYRFTTTKAKKISKKKIGVRIGYTVEEWSTLEFSFSGTFVEPTQL